MKRLYFARFPGITRCSRRIQRRQTIENLITSNNKNGYLDAALSQESLGNGDNGCTNVRRLRVRVQIIIRGAYTEGAD